MIYNEAGGLYIETIKRYKNIIRSMEYTAENRSRIKLQSQNGSSLKLFQRVNWTKFPKFATLPSVFTKDIFINHYVGSFIRRKINLFEQKFSYLVTLINFVLFPGLPPSSIY